MTVRRRTGVVALAVALVIGALVLLWLALRADPAGRESGLLLTFEGQRNGATTVVRLRAENVGEDGAFNGYDIRVSFTPSVARVVDVQPGDGWDVSLVPPEVENGMGEVRVVAVTFGTPCAGSCDLFALTFAGVGNGGVTEVSISRSAIASPDGRLVASSSSAFEIEVGGPE